MVNTLVDNDQFNFEKLQIVVTGGGSGGHTSAAIGIIEALIHAGLPRDNFLWIGSSTGIERQVAMKHKVAYRPIPVGKLRRYWSLQNFLDIPRILHGLIKSLGILRSCNVSVVIGTGGFVSVPVVLSARFLGIPIIVHEQTIIPGLANRVAARFASKVLLTFPETIAHFDRTKTSVIGNPLRAELCKGLPSKEEAVQRLSLDINLPVIYVTGGAQGASALNKAVADALPELLRDWQVIHQCGINIIEYGKEYLRNIASKLPKELAQRYLVMPYVGEEIVDVFASADLLLSRSGAAIVNEIMQLGLASILVPYPKSVGQEQEHLARMLERAGGAIVVKQSELNGQYLINLLKGFNAEKRDSMRKQAKLLASEHVEDRVVAEIMSIATHQVRNPYAETGATR